MSGSHITQAQFQAYNDCLHRIYGEPTGEDPIPAILDAIEELMRLNSLASDETKGNGTRQGGGTRILRHRHLGSRGFEGHPWVSNITISIAHDHPIIQHVLTRGFEPLLKMSDFVTQRQMHNISLYEFNKKVHEWRDQAILLVPVNDRTISISLNRDRVFTGEEYFLLRQLQPHISRVTNRCALFMSLPGNEKLTAREREILYWVTQGKTDDAIACIVRCRPGTVSKHLRNILAKLNVENRATAVAMVLSGTSPDTDILRQGNVRS